MPKSGTKGSDLSIPFTDACVTIWVLGKDPDPDDPQPKRAIIRPNPMSSKIIRFI
jgi:hypothetical protein